MALIAWLASRNIGLEKDSSLILLSLAVAVVWFIVVLIIE